MASSGNFAVFNPLSCQEGNGAQGTAADDLSNANTKFTITNDSSGMAVTIATPPSGGKWYCEFYLSGSVGNYAYVGYYPVAETPETKKQWAPSSNTTWVDTAIVSVHSMGRYFYTEGQYTDSGATSFTAGDIISIALDLDNGATYFAKNNTWMNSGNPESGSSKTGAAPVEGAYSKEYLLAVGSAGSTGHAWTINAGQDSTFGGAVSAGGNADGNGFGDFKYAPPSGYLALCSANIPISDDIDPAQTDDNHPTKQFNVVTYTGNGGTQSINVGFQPDLLWFKNRGTANSPILFDSTRGTTKTLNSDKTNAESTGAYTNLAAFTSTGFNLSGGGTGDVNQSSASLVAWCWRANGGTTTSDSSGDITVTRQTNDAAKFSILTYTGSGSSGNTIAHGLGVKPAMTIIKERGGANGWNVWHQGNNDGDYDSFGELNSSSSWYQNQGSNGPFSAAPGTDYLTLTAYGQVNNSSDTYVAYVWADVEGFQKFGKFEGNSDNFGPFVYTGFRPRLLFIKNSESTSPWTVYDGERGGGFNNAPDSPAQQFWDTGLADHTSYGLEIFSNGFKLVTSNATVNSSHTWLYGAWGDVPFKYNNTF